MRLMSARFARIARIYACESASMWSHASYDATVVCYEFTNDCTALSATAVNSFNIVKVASKIGAKNEPMRRETPPSPLTRSGAAFPCLPDHAPRTIDSTLLTLRVFAFA